MMVLYSALCSCVRPGRGFRLSVVAWCAATAIRTANRLLAEIDRRRRTVADLSASTSQILAIVEGAGEPPDI